MLGRVPKRIDLENGPKICPAIRLRLLCMMFGNEMG